MQWPWRRIGKSMRREVHYSLKTEEETMEDGYTGRPLTRRLLLGQAGVAGLALATAPAWAQATIELSLPGGPSARPITTAFPEKASMILQRSRPPLLETPFEVFDKGVFTPNNEFYVRWHWAVIPTEVDVDKFHLAVRGHVTEVLSLSLQQVLSLPRVELAAVNQCSGNSRGFFPTPRCWRRMGERSYG
jgi:DMSO/TMAO reductase YedYZ molybdopterin-dependent catalytic subunit